MADQSTIRAHINECVLAQGAYAHLTHLILDLCRILPSLTRKSVSIALWWEGHSFEITREV